MTEVPLNPSSFRAVPNMSLTDSNAGWLRFVAAHSAIAPVTCGAAIEVPLSD